MPRPFANSQAINPALIEGDWLLGIQTGNNTGDETYKDYNITLANDLEFVKEEGLANYTPIGYKNGSEYKSYCGTFDGAGYTIKGIQTNPSKQSGDANRFRALIGVSGDGCTVQNLTIKDSTFTGLEYVSAVVGAAVGALTVKNVRVENVTIEGNPDNGNNVGGLCGRFFQAAAGDSLFENCTVNATMSAAKNVAGICGGEASSGDMTITIRNCLAAGTYETKTTAEGSGTAGIFGFANGKVKVTIENCISIADLIAGSGETGSMLSMIRRSEYVIKNSIGVGSFIGYILLEDGTDPVPTAIDAESAVMDPKKEANVETVSLFTEGKVPSREPDARYTLTIGGESKTFVDATTPLIDFATMLTRVGSMYEDESFKTMALDFVNNNMAHEHVFDRKDTSSKYVKIYPTCQIKGVYYYSCSICGLADPEGTTFEGETGEHRFATGWSTSETEHWHTCLDCNTEKSDVEAHTFGEWTVKREATEKRDGERECECTICGYKKTEKIAKLTPASSNQTNETAAQNQSSTEKKGCGSTLGVGFGMIATIAFVGGFASRKKKERK